MKYLRTLLFPLLLLWTVTSHAGQTLVLVHGYLGDGSSWRTTGIVATLQHAGWQDLGHLLPHHALPGGGGPFNHEKYLYSLTLPSEAPLIAQAQWLNRYLHILQTRHPDNDLILVGHSVGGVVGRLSMVYGAPVKGLITIASPHLGTDKAEWGTFINQTPLSWITPLLGLGTINRSEALYWDLNREYPATALFWLNRQPHPTAHYVSLIRVNESTNWNSLVPAYSQDMNNVPALMGRSVVVPSIGGHYLHPADGPIIASLLANFEK